VFGSAVMGYGDLFVAAVLGALLAVAAGRSLQLRAARLAALLALVFDLLFFLVEELPATVPIAVTLVVLLARGGVAAPFRRPVALARRVSRREPAFRVTPTGAPGPTD
jgi:hypothetical protein